MQVPPPPKKQALFWAGCSGRHEGDAAQPLTPGGEGSPRALGCQRGARGGRSPGLTLPGSGASGPSASSTAPRLSLRMPPASSQSPSLQEERPTAWTAVGIPSLSSRSSWKLAAGGHMGSWLAALRSSRSGGEEQEARPGSPPSAVLTQRSLNTRTVSTSSPPRVISTGVWGPFPWIST